MPKEAITVNKPTVKEYAREVVIEKWGESEWEYFDDLIHRESSWNHLAQNSSSTAFGLGQFLNSTWDIVDCEKTDNPYIQIDCTVKYIEDRYKTPSQSITFHNRNNWY